jgi:DNA-directed RNA polymerase specialized sigma24 family protein
MITVSRPAISLAEQKHFARQVQSGKFDKYLPMIAQKARALYDQLPSSEKMGTSIEDLIQEGKLVAFSQAARTWSPKKNTKFSTYLFVCLDNFYTDRLRKALADRRCAKVYSPGNSRLFNQSTGKEIDIFDYVATRYRHSIEDKLIARIDAERGFLKAYDAADFMLRKYLIRWVLCPEQSKAQDGADFRAAVEQFDSNAAKHLTIEMCRLIHSSLAIRQTIAGAVVSRFVTPRKGIKVVTKMSESREYVLLDLLPVDRQRSVKALI